MAKQEQRQKSRLSRGTVMVIAGVVVVVILAGIGLTSRNAPSTPTPTLTATSTASATITDTPTRTITPTPEFLTYYVNSSSPVKVRECADTACDVLTMVDGGAELQVVDDSGDWYELRLDNGSTGYIVA
jgi:hypothetical protein